MPGLTPVKYTRQVKYLRWEHLRQSLTNNLTFYIQNRYWIISVLVLILVTLAHLAGLFTRWDLSLYDSFFRLRGTQDPGQDVVIVVIDEKSINRMGAWPWPRTVHAQLLQKLQGARTVAFDLTFGTARDAAEDEAFARAIKAQGHVVLASKFSFERDEEGELLQVFEPPIPTLMKGAAALGFVNTPTDIDQVVRRITLVDTNTFAVPFPSLGLAAALEARGLSPLDIELKKRYLVADGQQIPLDESNRALPEFWGPRETFTSISYVDILQGTVSPDYFQDKIVLVGVNTQEEHDDYPTPFTTSNMVKSGRLNTPGVEIHAAVAQSFLAGRWYKQGEFGATFLLLLFLTGAAPLFIANRGPFKGLLNVMVLLVALAGSVYLLWLKQRIYLNLASPLMALGLSYVLVTASDFVKAELARRRTRAMFSRYVSPRVADEILKNPFGAELGGKKQELSIMFCDIRGFTAFSENKDPQEVIARLNQYLTVMTQVIFRHGGTLDKYLGDGLMAFFGAPVYYEDHADRAIQAAKEIQLEVEKLNQGWAARGEVPLKVACGINSGTAVVGNVGSPERMDYTLIGEEVNLASRVEALSKLFQVLIVISERTLNFLTDDQIRESLYYLGAEKVKGFTRPIACYSIKGMQLSFEKSNDTGFK